MKTFGIVALSFIVIGLFLLVFVIPFTGLHFQTAQGEHTGFITATETSGIFFKTHTAYLKTDTQSSQEDAYCVVGEDVFAKLREKTETKEKVTVEYIDWFSKGMGSCNAEMGGVIIGVK